MDSCESYPIRHLKTGRLISRDDPVVREARIELDINNGQLQLGMLCLPQQLDALGVGFLLGEGILRREDVGSVEVVVEGSRVQLRGSFDADALETIHNRWTWATGCGGGGTAQDVEAPAFRTVNADVVLDAGVLLELSREFHSRSRLWSQTGGVHTCALACKKEILVFAEDIGRHNAFDKVMGIAAMEGIDVDDKLVLTTGRLSADIVSKALACGVPVLVSRSAVTTLAIDAARRFGITLVGFLRARRLNVYTGFERITAAETGASSQGTGDRNQETVAGSQ